MNTQGNGPASALPDVRQRTFLGHPVGLYVLFFTEMWERFSYYGMRALLILYMVKYYKWSQENASSVYKWYTSLVYLTPLLGGYLADRYLGNKRAVIIGAVLMAIGHFLMAYEPYPAFYAALIFLILGNGFFKPNMSTQVGRLYPQNDPRRDGAYTIFYMGINLGAFLSPLLCGWLAENTPWQFHAGFTAAGIGMLCGLLVYLFGLPWVIELPPAGKPVPSETEAEALKNGHALRSASEGIKALPAGISAAPATGGPAGGEITPEETVQPLGSAAQGPEITTVPRGPDRDPLPPESTSPPPPLSEEEAERTPSSIPFLNHLSPGFLLVLGVILAVAAPLLALRQLIAWDSAIGLEIAAGCSFISAWITARVHQAVRDRVLAIYLLGIFVVFFWAAFEQAGNALNLWADQTTDRYLTATPPPMPMPPAVQARVPGWLSFLNPVPTTWFQSINALAIFVLAPLFAYLWTKLGQKGLNPSVPTKMAFGVVLMGLSFALMIVAARHEDRPSSTELGLSQLPPGLQLESDGTIRPEPGNGEAEPPYHAGRLTFDRATGTLHLRGVLPDTERDHLVRDSAPRSFKDLADILGAVTPKLDSERKRVEVKLDRPLTIDPKNWFPGDEVEYDAKSGTLALTASLPLEVHLAQVPPGFDVRYAGFTKDEVTSDPATQTLTVNARLAGKDVKSLLVAGGEPKFRAAIYRLYVESSAYRVSAWWLFWFYILATLGELCLSPVGLSMVSKLAPARFATMLMGMWLLTSFFGNFAAGAFGEQWDKLDPITYFIWIMAALLGASVVLFVLVRKIVSMMHGVT